MFDPSLTPKVLPLLWLVSMILHCRRMTQPVILKGKDMFAAVVSSNNQSFLARKKSRMSGPRQL